MRSVHPLRGDLALIVISALLAMAPTPALAGTPGTRPAISATAATVQRPQIDTHSSSAVGDEMRGLAEREKTAQKQEQFRGGTVVVVTSSAIALALLIVLIIVLI